MNLRIAKKVMKAVGTKDQDRYSDFQIGVALCRYKKTKSSKETEEYWNEVVIPIYQSNPHMFGDIND